jgi:hypothetical protein
LLSSTLMGLRKRGCGGDGGKKRETKWAVGLLEAMLRWVRSLGAGAGVAADRGDGSGVGS